MDDETGVPTSTPDAAVLIADPSPRSVPTVHDGYGAIDIREYFGDTASGMNLHVWELAPGVTEGMHTHAPDADGDAFEEIYYVISGEGTRDLPDRRESGCWYPWGSTTVSPPRAGSRCDSFWCSHSWAPPGNRSPEGTAGCLRRDHQGSICEGSAQSGAGAGAKGRYETPRVRTEGLEPPRDYAHQDLNLARLPIPPRPHRTDDATSGSGRRRTPVSRSATSSPRVATSHLVTGHVGPPSSGLTPMATSASSMDP